VIRGSGLEASIYHVPLSGSRIRQSLDPDSRTLDALRPLSRIRVHASSIGANKVWRPAHHQSSETTAFSNRRHHLGATSSSHDRAFRADSFLTRVSRLQAAARASQTLRRIHRLTRIPSSPHFGSPSGSSDLTLAFQHPLDLRHLIQPLPKRDLPWRAKGLSSMTRSYGRSRTKSRCPKSTLPCIPWRMAPKSAHKNVSAKVRRTRIIPPIKLMVSRCSSTGNRSPDRGAVLHSRPNQAQHTFPQTAFLSRRPPYRRASPLDHPRGYKDSVRRTKYARNGRPHYGLW
jgi:hypothetical protein